MTGAGDGRVEVGDGVVHRPAQVWTPAVHDLLQHLHDRLPGRVPRPVAVAGGIETVTHLPGAAGPDCWVHQATDRGLVSAARLLRAVHDAGRDHVPAAGARWAVAPVGPAEVFCHGDPGPWNTAWREGRAVGLFDWDLAHPGPALDDVAYALEHLVPFRGDAECRRWRGFARPPDRPGRLRAFVRAYGWTGPPDVPALVDAVVARQERTADDVRALAAAGVEPQGQWVRDGYLDDLAARVRWSRENRHLLVGDVP